MLAYSTYGNPAYSQYSYWGYSELHATFTSPQFPAYFACHTHDVDISSNSATSVSRASVPDEFPVPPSIFTFEIISTNNTSNTYGSTLYRTVSYTTQTLIPGPTQTITQTGSTNLGTSTLTQQTSTITERTYIPCGSVTYTRIITSPRGSTNGTVPTTTASTITITSTTTSSISNSTKTFTDTIATSMNVTHITNWNPPFIIDTIINGKTDGQYDYFVALAQSTSYSYKREQIWVPSVTFTGITIDGTTTITNRSFGGIDNLCVSVTETTLSPNLTVRTFGISPQKDSIIETVTFNTFESLSISFDTNPINFTVINSTSAAATTTHTIYIVKPDDFNSSYPTTATYTSTLPRGTRTSSTEGAILQFLKNGTMKNVLSISTATSSTSTNTYTTYLGATSTENVTAIYTSTALSYYVTSEILPISISTVTNNTSRNFEEFIITSRTDPITSSSTFTINFVSTFGLSAFTYDANDTNQSYAGYTSTFYCLNTGKQEINTFFNPVFPPDNMNERLPIPAAGWQPFGENTDGKLYKAFSANVKTSYSGINTITTGTTIGTQTFITSTRVETTWSYSDGHEYFVSGNTSNHLTNIIYKKTATTHFNAYSSVYRFLPCSSGINQFIFPYFDNSGTYSYTLTIQSVASTNIITYNVTYTRENTTDNTINLIFAGGERLGYQLTNGGSVYITSLHSVDMTISLLSSFLSSESNGIIDYKNYQTYYGLNYNFSATQNTSIGPLFTVGRATILSPDLSDYSIKLAEAQTATYASAGNTFFRRNIKTFGGQQLNALVNESLALSPALYVQTVNGVTNTLAVSNFSHITAGNDLTANFTTICYSLNFNYGNYNADNQANIRVTVNSSNMILTKNLYYYSSIGKDESVQIYPNWPY